MSTTSLHPDKVKNFRKIIIALSIAIPVVVAVLFKVKIEGVNLSFLPPIYAGINAVTALLLSIALVAIKNKNVALHKLLINICLGLSLLFLACYVAYHMTSDPTIYGDFDKNGILSIQEYKQLNTSIIIYRIILFTHIILSVVVIPIVLFTYLFAWQGDFDKHRKWTKIAFPLWLYVAITGVIVYIMIAPYYAHV